MAQKKVSSYLKNVGKSFGYAVGDVVSDYVPVASSIVRDTKSTYKDVKYSMQNMMRDNVSSATKDFMSDKNILTNTLDDLKSGKWYNKEREDNMFGGDLDLDFDMDFDDDWGDDDESSSSAADIISQNESSTKEIIGSMGQVGSEVSKSVAYSNARSAEYIVASNNAASKALYDLNKQGFSQVTSVLLNMDNTLAGFAELGNGLATHMQNSTVFFSQTTDTLNKMNESLDILVERTKYMEDLSKGQQQAKYKKGNINSIAPGGDFDLGSYIEMVKENTKDTTDLVKSMADMIGMVGGKNGENLSLTQFATKALIEKAIPKLTKEAMKSFNETLNDTIINGMRRAGNKASSSSNILLNILGGIFLPKDKMDKSFDTSKYSKGPVAWDGVARKALVDVIPTYLASIEKALTGKAESQVFDYNTGKYTTRSAITETRNLELKSNIRNSGGEYRKEILSKTDDTLVRKAIEEYFAQSFEKGGNFHEVSKYRNMSDSEKSDMKKKYFNNSAKAEEAIDLILEVLSTDEGRKMARQFERRNTQNRASYDNKMRDAEVNGLSNYSNIYNGFNDSGYVSGNGRGPARSNRVIHDSAAQDYTETYAFKDLKKQVGSDILISEDEFYKYMTLSNEGKQSFIDKKKLDDVVKKGKDTLHKATSSVGEEDSYLKPKNFLEVTKYYWEQPFAVINTALNNLTAGINELFWGEGGEGGILETIKKKTSEFWDELKKKLFDNDVVNDFKEQMKTSWTNIKTKTKTKVGEFMFGKQGYADRQAKKQAAKTAADDTSEGASGSGLPIAGGSSRDYANDGGAVGLISDGATKLYKGISGFIEKALYGDNPEEEKKKVFGSIKDVFGEMGDNKGAIGIGAITGAGVSLLTGAVVGPLAGAAIGGAVGLAAKSQKFQDFLFGSYDPDDPEKFNKGVLGAFGKKIKDNGGKDAKATGIGAGIGLVGGTVLGSPILGAVLGSAAGYVSSSEKAKNYLFGSTDENGNYQEGVIPKELQDKIKANAPSMTAGAIAGLLVGPFGLVGNLVVGAGVGMVASSSKFHEFMFGKEGTDDKGLAGKIHDKIINPLDEIMHNLSNAMTGFLRRLGANVNSLLKSASEKIGGVLKKLSNSKTPGGKMLNFAGKLGSGLVNAPISLLGGALNMADTALKRSNLKTGSSVYDKDLGRNMTASERLEAAKIMKNGQISQDENGNYYRTDINGRTKKISSLRAKLLQKQSDKGKATKYKYSGIDAAIAELDEATISKYLKDDKALTEFAQKHGLTSSAQVAQVKSLLGDEMSGKYKKDAKGKFKDINEKMAHYAEETASYVKGIYSHITGKPVEGTPNTSTTKSDGEGEETVVTDILGGTHKKDAEGEDLANDSETKQSNKRITQLFDNITKIGPIATAMSGVKGIFSTLKEGLLGDGEKKTGLLGLLTGAVGGIFSFFTGKDISGIFKGSAGEIVKGLFGKVSLSSVLTNIAGPALLAAGLGGAFDKSASALTGDAYNESSKSSTRTYDATLTDGSSVKYTYDKNGNMIDTATGKNISKDSIASVNGSSSGRASFSDKLKENFARNTITGKSSVVSKVLGKTKVAKAITGSTVAKDAASAVKGADAASGLLLQSSVVDSLSKIGTKLVPVLSKFGIDEKTVSTMCSELGTKIANALSSNVAKNAAKIAGSVITFARIAFVAVDFATGYQDARTTLGITAKPTLGQRVVSGIIRVIKNLIPVVGTLIPDSLIVDVVVKYIAPALGIDVSELMKQREEAQAETDAYNKEHGTNLSVGDYNKEVLHDYTFTEKIGNKLSATKENIKNGGVGKAIAKMGNGIKKEFTQNVDITATLLKHMNDGDIKGLWSEDFSGSEKEDNPVNIAQKAMATNQKILLTTPTLVIGAGRGIAKIISRAASDGKELISAMANSESYGEKMLNEGESFDKFWDFENGGVSKSNWFRGIASPLIAGSRILSAPVVIAKRIFKKVGDTIKSIWNKVTTPIKTDASSFTQSMGELKDSTYTGDINGMISNFLWKSSDDNILGGAFEFAHGIGSIVPISMGLFHKMGDGIKSAWNKATDAIKTDASSFSESMKNLGNATSSMDLSEMWNQFTWKASDANPLGKVFEFAHGFASVGNILYNLLGVLGNGIGGLWDKAKDKVSSWFGKDDTKTKVTTGKTSTGIAQKAYNWVTGGGSSGFVSQFDPAYQNYTISGSSFAGKGCGPAVASMAASALGKNLSVGSAVSKSTEYQVDNGVTLDYFQNALGSQGIDTQVIAGGSSSDLYNSIASGKKVILLGQDRSNTSKAFSPFGPNNHYVLATGLDRSGNVIVNDPEANGPRVYNPSILNSAKYGVVAGRGSGIRRNKAIPRAYRNLFAGGGGVRNDETTQQIWAFLTTKLGMSEAAAAGVMGNMQQESGCEPDKHQKGGPAYGLCQWEGGRKNNLMSRPNYQSLAVQLQYLAEELPSQYWSKSGSKSENGKNYSWSSMSYDDFKRMSDVAQATIKFEAAFERAGKPKFDQRIEYASQYYQMFTGKSYSYNGEVSGSSDSGPQLFTNIFNTVSDLGTVFGNAFSFLTGNNSSSSSGSTGSSGAVGSYNFSGTDPVSYMKSVKGKLKYSMSGARDPEKGSADCSSTVRWAVKKATGIDIGSSTANQYTSSNLKNVWYNNGKYADSLPQGIQPNDILFFSRPNDSYTSGRPDRVGHVGIYEGDGKYLHHGGGANGNVPGPTEDTLKFGNSGKLIKVSRLAASGSGLASYNDIATLSGGSSGALLASRAGSNNGQLTIIDPHSGRLVPVNRFAGGASNITEATKAMLGNISSNATSSAKFGTVSSELVAKLLESITKLLTNIADNTAPVNKIYNALVAYLEAGGSSGTSGDTKVIKKTNDVTSTYDTSGEIDSNISNLVGVLAELAKG